MSGSATLRYFIPMRGTHRQSLFALLLAAVLLQPAAAQDWTPPADGPGTRSIPRDDPRVPRGDGFRRDRMPEDMRVVPLDTVMAGLMAQYPGKPLDARGPMRRGAQLIYEVVWLTPDGRQIVVIVDARSGNVLRVRGLG
jgi:hypothetical protein